MGEIKHSILIVDDEAIILRTLGEMLGDAGYDVVTSLSPTEALNHLRSRRFAVVISDQQMDEMLGLDFLHEARGIQPNASRILVTGLRSLDMVVSAINEGEIFRFVAKPWVRAEMLATVGNAIQRFELIEDNQRLQADTQRLNDQLTVANATLRQQVSTLETQKQQLDESRRALRSNFDRSIELCYRIINTFNPLLGEQAKMVADICERMAATPYFTEEEKHVLMTSAWLHDIGLTGVPREAVQAMRSTPMEDLSPENQRLLREHPIYGQTLASFVDNLKAVGDTIRAHHEHFDGKGYPDGLARESIPWTARCLAVVVYYASSSEPHDSTIERVLELSGTAFDPEAVRLFLRSTQSGKVPRHMREITVAELSPGMQLAKGIYSPTGILLIPEGQHLDAPTIAKLRNHSLLTSLPQQLLVFS